MGLSALYDIPVWLPTFGDLSQEWWAVAKLPDDVMAQLKEMQMAWRPVAAPRTPPGPPPFDGAGRDYGHGQFDPNSLIGSMPSVGNAVLDSVTWPQGIIFEWPSGLLEEVRAAEIFRDYILSEWMTPSRPLNWLHPLPWILHLLELPLRGLPRTTFVCVCVCCSVHCGVGFRLL